MRGFIDSLSDLQKIAMIGMAIGFSIAVLKFFFDDPGLSVAYYIIYWPSLAMFWVGVIQNLRRDKPDSFDR